jgi:hypothetical protein
VGEFSKSVSRQRQQECPECGEFIPASATVCPECDAVLVDADEDKDRPRRRTSRSRDCEPHRGSMIMVMGILSFFVAGLILGPITWILGRSDLKKMREGTMDPEGESQTRTGVLCAMISTIIHGVGLVIGLIIAVLMIVVFGGAVFCIGSTAVKNAPPAKTGTSSPGVPASSGGPGK